MENSTQKLNDSQQAKLTNIIKIWTHLTENLRLQSRCCLSTVAALLSFFAFGN